MDVEKYLKVPGFGAEEPKGIAGKPELPALQTDKVILCGQDIVLDIIANNINASIGYAHILRSHAGSCNSLYSLYLGQSQIATAHLWDEKTKEYNYPYIQRLVPGTAVTVIRLFGRKQGYYIKKGNPLGISGWEDLKRFDLTFCNREKGSGTRVLLDEKLKAMNIKRSLINGYEREYPSHLSVAAAVARSEGDFGLGSEHGCQQVADVEFIPLHNEWYDLVFQTEMEDIRPYRDILDYVCSEGFIRELTGIGGYDISQTGRVVRL
jgi:putative molybdopterin biosynthesis protein